MTSGVAGIDEAGRGPVLGPLVVAAVRVDRQEDLDDLELRDSKRMVAEAREEMDEAVRARADVEVAVVEPDVIDRYRLRGTINALEVEVFGDLVARLAPARVLVDAADVDADRFGRRVAARARGTDGTASAAADGLVRPAIADVDVVAEHGADARHPVVSAASIVAKVERDRRVAAIGEEVGADVGSGYPSDPVTTAFLESWLADHGDLPPHTRRSWKSARRLVADAGQQALSEF